MRPFPRHPADAAGSTLADPAPATATDAVSERASAESPGCDWDDLVRGSERLAMSSLPERRRLIEACRQNVMRVAPEWVDTAVSHPPRGGPESSSHVRAEEVFSGPAVTSRYLRLLGTTLKQVEDDGLPRLPGRPRVGVDGRLQVPLAPVRGLYDGVTYRGFRAWARMKAGITARMLPERMAELYRRRAVDSSAGVAVVLGAGNISSVPVLDACDRIFAHGQAVLLKLHPLHECLQPVFERLLAPLVEAGCLQIITGGADVGARAVAHESVDEVHVTGGLETHETIVWGPPGPGRDERKRLDQPLLDKPISAELGSVTPWIIVPGAYSDRELDYQAENVAASVINNAGCNCVSTRVLVTWRGWRDRERFVERVEEVLATAPPREPWYPGAAQRYSLLTGQAVADGPLAAAIVRDVDPLDDSPFFDREPFTCVMAEVPLEASSEEEFLDTAIAFCNERLWGTLAATLTVPKAWQRGRGRREQLDARVAGLRYGMVGINQWIGLNYALASPPWGGHSSSTPQDIQSGAGRVHNTFLLDGVDQTVMSGPLRSLPRPAWFPSHPAPEPVAWALLDLYDRPSPRNLWQLIRHSRW